MNDIKSDLQSKINLKTKPVGSLGVLEGIALKIGLIQNTLLPSLHNPVMIVFAADHGISDAGVSPFPKEVTGQMVHNFINGGAAINVFCKQNQIELKVVDAGVDADFPESDDLINMKIRKGTSNILEESAMTLEECREAMSRGGKIVIDEAERGCNIIGFGEMGIGNTSSSALLMNMFTSISIEECVGRGTGHDDEGLKNKVEILKQVLLNRKSGNDPVEILAVFGGFEIAMMTGAFLKAYELNMVILVDGFIATSALLCAYKINNNILDNCIFCHCSDEKGHALMLEYLNQQPLLNLGMRLGEGTGAAIAFPIVQSAVNFLNEMASFESAGVSNKD